MWAFVGILALAPLTVEAQAATTTPTKGYSWYLFRGFETDIATLPKEAAPTIPLPVISGVSLSDIVPDFGDPRGSGRTHAGQDILVPKGSPIASPTEAVVLKIGSGEREGISVYTANPGGEMFVYMHLDRVAEGLTQGTRLAQGDLIGYVGNTGNAASGPAHLHFEIHNAEGETVDPYPRFTGETVKLALATSTVPVVPAPSRDLEEGDTGDAVSELQTFLITQSTGPQARLLKNAGATGVFGAVTKAALSEYQQAIGIFPARGYYGPKTRTAILSGAQTTHFTRDLTLGSVGEDVRLLQQLLNAKGYTVASEGAGSPGRESTYFGEATRAAVVRLQLAEGVSPALGYVGIKTRSVLI